MAAEFHADTVAFHAAFAEVILPRLLKFRKMKKELDVEAETREVISEDEEEFEPGAATMVAKRTMKRRIVMKTTRTSQTTSAI